MGLIPADCEVVTLSVPGSISVSALLKIELEPANAAIEILLAPDYTHVMTVPGGVSEVEVPVYDAKLPFRRAGMIENLKIYTLGYVDQRID